MQYKKLALGFCIKFHVKIFNRLVTHSVQHTKYGSGTLIQKRT